MYVHSVSCVSHLQTSAWSLQRAVRQALALLQETRSLALSGLEPVLRVNVEEGRKRTFFFLFFMTHIKFPHVSTNLVRTIKLPDCDSGLNNTFNQHRECTSWFSLWETILRDSTTQDKSRQKHGKGLTNFSKWGPITKPTSRK